MKKTYKIEVDCANCANLMGGCGSQDCWCAERYREFHDPEDDRGI